MTAEIKLGVSACLLGCPVRYDGGHKHDKYITGTLGNYFAFTAVCPEVECGLPVPRETMRLVGDPVFPRLVTTKTGIDHTEKMQTFCAGKLLELEKENLCGFIFKKNSPSSGLHRVKVYRQGGGAPGSGQGLFAGAFSKHFPRLPVEEEGRLNDPILRENFIEKVFCCYRWKNFVTAGANHKNLVTFHARHKLQIMAHSQTHLSMMGKLVAAGKTIPVQELLSQYESMLMDALSLKATVKKNVNVLQHIAGYFKKKLPGDDREELQGLIARYASHTVPLVVPLTLVNHYLRKQEIEYLQDQYYLEPHPAELMLRNHV